MKALLRKLTSFLGDQAVALILARLLTKENILRGVDWVLDQGEELKDNDKLKWLAKVAMKVREAIDVPEFDT